MLDDNSHLGFNWGMWSSSGAGLATKPWFYPWALLSRYFRPGSSIVESRLTSKDLRVLAAHGAGTSPLAGCFTSSPLRPSPRRAYLWSLLDDELRHHAGSAMAGHGAVERVCPGGEGDGDRLACGTLKFGVDFQRPHSGDK